MRRYKKYIHLKKSNQIKNVNVLSYQSFHLCYKTLSDLLDYRLKCYFKMAKILTILKMYAIKC